MNTHSFTLAGATLEARPAGTLVWPSEGLLVVSDLHLCKAARVARRQGIMLPPYETADTLARLADEIEAVQPKAVICLGDSFDDLAAADELEDADRARLAALQAGRTWIWIEGNHDPGPIDLGGTHRWEITIGGLTFRHIAEPDAQGEISGHYHPKATLDARGRRLTKAAFLYDAARLVMPAFGTYTGGLNASSGPLRRLFPGGATAVLTGRTALAFPVAMGAHA